MLGALEVVSHDLRSNCNFSMFGGVQALDEILQRCERAFRNNPNSINQFLADGKVTPLQGVWKVILANSQRCAPSEEQNEAREAYLQMFHRSVVELTRLGHFTEEQALAINKNFSNFLKT